MSIVNPYQGEGGGEKGGGRRGGVRVGGGGEKWGRGEKEKEQDNDDDDDDDAHLIQQCCHIWG